jgi:hypothetical protein
MHSLFGKNISALISLRMPGLASSNRTYCVITNRQFNIGAAFDPTLLRRGVLNTKAVGRPGFQDGRQFLRSSVKQALATLTTLLNLALPSPHT